MVKGLYLQISDNGAKSFVLRFERHGRERMLGIGPAATLSLKEARERARAARLLLLDGIDPVDHKHAAQEAAKLAEARKITFAEAARLYFDQNEKRWRNASYRDEFLRSLEAYAFPTIGRMDVAAIDTGDVLRAIDPIWKTKSVTADRVRNRIEAVIDWSVVRGHRPPGDNPARWKGHLDQVLPAVHKIAPVEHHAAMPYRDVPAFMVELRKQQGSAALGLQFLILTAARSGEVRFATWDEIDFDNKTWTIPGERMKGGREHRQPLSEAALDILRSLPREDGNPHLFIGGRAGAGLSNMAFFLLMERMGLRGSVTVHGFRSAFSDWAHEQTAHSAHTIEISLAHAVGAATERAYRRGDMVTKRARLMSDWAKFCATPSVKIAEGSNVKPIRGRA